MTIETARAFLLWCTAINYGVLILWFVVFVFARDGLQRIHGRWFHLSRDQFDVLHYGGMTLFKLAVILFNLVPLAALFIVG
jgi:hypothetical protein